MQYTKNSTSGGRATVDELQTLSPTELREKIMDLSLLLDADEEYIKTLERRNETLWGTVRKLEERLCKSGLPFQPFNNHN